MVNDINFPRDNYRNPRTGRHLACMPAAPFLRLIALSFLLLGFGESRSTAYAQQYADGFIEEELAVGLNPSTMAVAPDGRIFIVEKDGRIRLYRDGELRDAPFLDIEVDDKNERGLSGLAFHPDFERNGYFYIYYTVLGRSINRVSRLRANGDFAIPGSEEVLLELDLLRSSIHNGGAMVWLPDTTMLIAVGDGGDGDIAQDLDNTGGKILRIRDDGAIPTDNPFYATAEGIHRAVYASGFRNPYTMARQSSSGRVFANDVGGSKFEEVNEVVAGKNYGWPLVEGLDGLSNAPDDHQRALHLYDHDVGCAVIGATFYPERDAPFPAQYHGAYFFSDYCKGWLRALDPGTGEVIGTIASGLKRPIALHAEASGDLLYLARPGIGDGSIDDNTATDIGGLYRVRYTGTGAPVVSRPPRDILLPVGETARFAAQAVGAAPLTYAWLRDGERIVGEEATTLDIGPLSLSDDGTRIQVVVANGEGADTSAVATLSVTANTRPLPSISTPSTSATYAAGEMLTFGGTATDSEDGDLGAGALTWKVDFHHDDHAHPGRTLAGVKDGEYLIPAIGETSANVFYRVYLTATDSEGLTQTTSVDIQPRKSEFTLSSVPEGVALNADGETIAGTTTITSVVGLLRTLQAPPIASVGGETYVFEGWALDGVESASALTRFTVSATPQEAVARYRKLPSGQGNGLRGEYFTGRDFADEQRVLTRVDTTVDFEWQLGSPAVGRLPEDDFSVRWTGFVEPVVDGIYEFATLSDDGIRVTVDGQVVIDELVDQAPTTHIGSVALRAGEIVPLTVEYYEAGGGAVAKLLWRFSQVNSQIVPRDRLYHFPVEPGEGGGLSVRAHVMGTQHVRAWVRMPDGVNEGTLEVYDIAGRQLVRQPVDGGNGDWRLTDLREPGIIPGTYTLVLRADGERSATKFIMLEP